MCELFAMSARFPSGVELSLEEFSRRGGLTGVHKDGWGIAWYEHRDLRLVKEPSPAASSACVRFLQSYPLQSALLISHVRKATQGGLFSRNTQPYARELGGAWHAFAHNGDLGNLAHAPRFHPTSFRPVGETDSELAFCVLLDRLRPLWNEGLPPLGARLSIVNEFAQELRCLGIANFLYSDGDAIFAHGHRRHQLDGSIRAPGLWRLARQCSHGADFATDGLRINAGADDQRVLLFASVPLTTEGWEPLAEGEVTVAREGLSVMGEVRDAARAI
jgi:predicted glutamine amidotransferase